MISRKKAQKTQKTGLLFVFFYAFLRLSVLLAFFGVIFGAAKKESAPLDFAAISYYNDHCARCHGPDGVNYDLKHLAQSSDEKLSQVIELMAENQGQAPLEARQIAAQMAYHRSFMDGQPFVILSRAKTENGQLQLSGEVTPESQVQICLEEKRYPAQVEDQNWSITLPAPTDWKQVTIEVTKGNTKTELKAGEGFSHQK